MNIKFCILVIISSTNILSAQPNYNDWDKFLKKYVSDSGDVDYTAIKANKAELTKIINIFERSKPDKTWNKNEQLAFWINAYNVFTIQLITDNYPLKSIRDLDGGKTWDVKRIKIGSKMYSLNNIENDIIRPEFKDARIHFAVNCATKSCPPLLNAAFIPKTLDVQLDNQTKKFINHKKYQRISSSEIKLSKIMDWYAVDFGNVINFINKYSNTKIKPNIKIAYLEYDWQLNDSKLK